MVGRGWIEHRSARRAAVAALACLAACGGDGSPTTPPEEDGRFPRDPDSPLECEREGYPCIWIDADADVVATIGEILDSLGAMGARGLGISEARAWLAARSDVVELIADADALRFRLNGSGPVWVHERIGPTPGGGPASTLPHPIAPPVPARAPVGDDPYVKRALTLAPFLHEFGNDDETATVASMLRSTRGYSVSSVVYVANPTTSSRNVTLEHFKHWDDYDVIHVSSHGETVCPAGGCRAQLIVARDPRPAAQVMRDWRGTGVLPSFSMSGGGASWVALDASFFADQYRGGLPNTIVFLSACETVGPDGSDLARAITGPSGAYLGWSAKVESDHARAAAIRLYGLLIDQGATVRSALGQLGDLRLNGYFKGDTFVQALLFRHGPLPPIDHRIRETVWIEHPETRVPLEPGDALTPKGRLGDGRPDSLEYRVKVDGIEGSPLDYLLAIEIDGARIDHPALIEGQAESDREWVVEGTAPLARDLVAGDRVPILAFVELPDGGRTEQQMVVEIAEAPISDWVGSATHRVSSSLLGTTTTVTTEATQLVFQRVADPTYPPGSERYEVVSGRLNWSIEGKIGRSGQADCTFGEGPFGFDVPPGSAYIEIDPNVSSGPPRYHLFGSFEDRTITIATSCSDVDFTTRIQSAWMAVFSDEDRRLSVDEQSIAGSKQNTRNEWTWNLIRSTPSGG